MSDVTNIAVKNSLFARLQKLAIPLIDDTSTVIERLIDHYEASPPKDTRPTQVWTSSRGDMLPVGETLKAKYLKHHFELKVELGGLRFNGRLYRTLSAAGMAAKQSVGTKPAAARTNGRTFWMIQDPTSGRWVTPRSYHGAGMRALAYYLEMRGQQAAR